MALLVPQVKDIITPEFELAVVATVNGGYAIYKRLKES
jgi:hypothetical protein